ncbi:unnamed protein product, partial [Rotaria magnacalcarata]
YLVELTFDSVLQSVYSFDHILNEGLQHNKSLKSLTLTNLDNLDAATIASLIKHNNTIKYLALTHDNISSGGGEIIADALRTNSTLVRVDLSHNHINEQITTQFTSILHQPHPSLTQIILNNNINDNQSVPHQNSTEENKPETLPFIVEEKRINDVEPSTPTKKFQFLSIILVTFLFFLWGIPNQL